MSPVTLKKFLKNNKHLLVLQPALAVALLLSTHHAFAKKDLFASEPNAESPLPAQEMISPPSQDEEEIAEPSISPTDAALRAQQHLDGKVMNVRQYQNENRTLYGVKVLQKNGRVSTVNVDATNGAIIK